MICDTFTRIFLGIVFNIYELALSFIVPCPHAKHEHECLHTAGQRNLTVGDPEWEHAKWAFRCTVLTGVTLKVCALARCR